MVRNPWKRQWQADLEEDPCFTCPIDPSGFKDSFWNGPFKEGPHQDDVKWTEQHWDNQSPDGIT